MRLRAITEALILIIFLVTALVAILVHNTASITDMGEGVKEHVQKGNGIYTADRAQFNEASIQYWEVIKQYPDMPEAHFKLAKIYYEYIWNYEALRELGEVERIDPNYPGLDSLLGKLYHRMGDTDRAFQSLQRAVTVQPGNSESHYYLGTIYQQRNMEEEAISEYEKAVREKGALTVPDNVAILRAYLQLGRIYKGKKEQEKAEREFRKALSIEPTSAEVISELRNIYKQKAEDYEYQNEYEKATEKYKEILEIESDSTRNVEIYMKLGNIYRSNELYDKATVMYEAATTLDPLNYDAFSALKELELLRNIDEGK